MFNGRILSGFKEKEKESCWSPCRCYCDHGSGLSGLAVSSRNRMEFGLVPILLPSVCRYKHKGYLSVLHGEAGPCLEPAGAGTGTKLVGGTTPGKGGKTHQGLLVLNPV